MKEFIKSHTSLTVIIIAALLIELTTGFIYYNSQDIIKRTTVRVMERENIALYLCIRNKLTEVEVVLDNMSWIVTDDLIQPDSLTRETYQIVENNPMILSSIPEMSFWRFLTIWGSKVPLRSFGTLKGISPYLLRTFFGLVPLRALSESDRSDFS